MSTIEKNQLNRPLKFMYFVEYKKDDGWVSADELLMGDAFDDTHSCKTTSLLTAQKTANLLESVYSPDELQFRVFDLYSEFLKTAEVVDKLKKERDELAGPLSFWFKIMLVIYFFYWLLK